jgi:AcrR family transcriptional regulator
MEKREAILKSAEKLFAEKGFKATNVAAVMEKANLGTGTFYNYFPSKEALFMEIFMEENVKLKKQIMRETDLNGDPIEIRSSKNGITVKYSRKLKRNTRKVKG